ncbi:hypothetical protein J22TS3_26570 [Paenibacillus sp. J22TS3]|nr:hypothetical protein J22TS3_26570 [Paenibacillus sp. J22TS3]
MYTSIPNEQGVDFTDQLCAIEPAHAPVLRSGYTFNVTLLELDRRVTNDAVSFIMAARGFTW